MSVTDKSVDGRVNHHGREIHVVDTPGFGDTRREKREEQLYDIGQAILMAREGAHAIYICVNLRNRFSDTDMATLRQIEQLGNLWNYAMVVFMNASALGQSSEEQERELKSLLSNPHQCPQDLNDLIRKVSHRYVLVEGSYLGNSLYRDQKLAQLLEMTDAIFQENREQRYNNRLFEIAKKSYDAAAEQLRLENSTTMPDVERASDRMQQESQAKEEQFRRQIDELNQQMAANKRKFEREREIQARDRQHQIVQTEQMRQETEAREMQKMRDDISRLEEALSLATRSSGHQDRKEPTPEAVTVRAYHIMKSELETDPWIVQLFRLLGRGVNELWNKATDKCSVM